MGLVLEANLTAATLLGMPRGMLVKQPITRFILKEDQDIYYLHRKQLFETGEPQKSDLRLVKLDGAFFWAHLAATTAQAEDGARGAERHHRAQAGGKGARKIAGTALPTPES
ncbi:MAG: PAS domain-containing protein [Thermodesulfobacteriota bacterium]|nr:PAS domain-containing protein [Thermodesulfobacteriota bacterium]